MGFIRAGVGAESRVGLAKQKDFAAKAYGFLVSCYYFIWPQTGFESQRPSPSPSRTCNFLQHSARWASSQATFWRRERMTGALVRCRGTKLFIFLHSLLECAPKHNNKSERQAKE